MSNPPPAITRRRALKRTFFFSAALALGAKAIKAPALEVVAEEQHFLMIGDWGAGVGSKSQKAVAIGMEAYARKLKRHPEGLFLIGDNFYGSFKGGVNCSRWKTDFEEMYPATSFPGPCWALLGNHDYDDEPITKVAAELAYAQAHAGTRWTMPAKWYRVQWPQKAPLITCLMLDSNYSNQSVSLGPEERQSQLAWLQEELAKPRTAPWLVVMGHHPLYTNGPHGDNQRLIEEWGPLFERAGVDFYFAGHDHDLQHLELDGLRTSFVLSGGGGARLYELKGTERGPYSQSVFGFTHLQVSAKTFLVRHLDANQKQLHAFRKTRGGQVEVLRS